MNEQISKWQVKNADKPASQMTKREMIAAMQMQKLNSGNYFNLEDMASDAVREADALLAELEKAGCAT